MFSFPETFSALDSQSVLYYKRELPVQNSGKTFIVYSGQESISSQGRLEETTGYEVVLPSLIRVIHKVLFSSSTLENRTKQERNALVSVSHPLSEQHIRLKAHFVSTFQVCFTGDKKKVVLAPMTDLAWGFLAERMFIPKSSSLHL